MTGWHGWKRSRDVQFSSGCLVTRSTIVYQPPMRSCLDGFKATHGIQISAVRVGVRNRPICMRARAGDGAPPPQTESRTSTRDPHEPDRPAGWAQHRERTRSQLSTPYYEHTGENPVGERGAATWPSRTSGCMLYCATTSTWKARCQG